MAMSLTEASKECKRWFQYQDDQRHKTELLGRIASKRRSGAMDHAEAEMAVKEVQGHGITVYDTAYLREAVELLLTHLRQTGEAV